MESRSVAECCSQSLRNTLKNLQGKFIEVHVEIHIDAYNGRESSKCRGQLRNIGVDYIYLDGNNEEYIIPIEKINYINIYKSWNQEQ